MINADLPGLSRVVLFLETEPGLTGSASQSRKCFAESTERADAVGLFTIPQKRQDPNAGSPCGTRRRPFGPIDLRSLMRCRHFEAWHGDKFCTDPACALGPTRNRMGSLVSEAAKIEARLLADSRAEPTHTSLDWSSEFRLELRKDPASSEAAVAKDLGDQLALDDRRVAGSLLERGDQAPEMFRRHGFTFRAGGARAPDGSAYGRGRLM